MILSSVLGVSKWAKFAAIGGLILAVAAVIGWLAMSRANLRADLAQARTSLAAVQTAYETNKVALAELKRISATKDEALAERDQAIKAIEVERDAARRKWREALSNEPETRDWADTPLPTAVRGLLQ
jgi:hypothetical protein